MNVETAKLLEKAGMYANLTSSHGNLCFLRALHSVLVGDFPDVRDPDVDEKGARQQLWEIAFNALNQQGNTVFRGDIDDEAYYINDEQESMMVHSLDNLINHTKAFEGLEGRMYLPYLANYYKRSFVIFSVNIEDLTSPVSEHVYNLKQHRVTPTTQQEPLYIVEQEPLYIVEMPGQSYINNEKEYSMHYIPAFKIQPQVLLASTRSHPPSSSPFKFPIVNSNRYILLLFSIIKPLNF